MSLADQIAAQQIVREQLAREAQAKRDEQRKAEQQQKQAELDQAIQQQATLQAQKAELEKEIANLTPEQQAAERQKAKEAGVAEIGKKYDDQIKAIIQERQKLASNKQTSQHTIRNLNGQIQALQGQAQREISFYEFAFDNPGATVGTRVYKEFSDPANVKSLSALTEQESTRQERQRLAAVQTSIVQAESERAKAQEKLDYTIKGFETARAEKTRQEAVLESNQRQEQNLKQAETGRYKITKDYSVEIRQGNKLAEPFKDLPDVNPESILGISQEKSKQALFTFEQTQQQQKELERQIRQSSGKAEADKIKSEFQKINPYVGTPNVHEYKGKPIESQGVTIEKELNTAIPNLEEKKPVKTTNKDITVSLNEQLNISEGIGGDITRNASAVNIPTVLIEDKSGKVRAPNVSEMWQLTKQTLGEAQISFIPTKADLGIAQYEKENLSEITAFEKSGKAKTSGSIKPLVDTNQDTFNAGFVGYFNEYGDAARGAETKNPSLETLGVSDVINLAEVTMTRKPLPRSSQLFETIKEKIQTPEGQTWLAGSAVAAGLANAVTFGGSVLLKGSSFGLKLTSIATKRTAKEAEQIAIKLASKSEDENFIRARLREQFPKMPESQVKDFAKEIIKTPEQKALERSIKEKFPQMPKSKAESAARTIISKTRQPTEPYGIEILDKKTALITTGTESTEGKVILYERGGISKVYSPPAERKALLTSILLKGRQTDAKEIRATIQRKFPQMPKAKLEETVKALSKDLEQGKIIITEKQARLAQKAKPIVKQTKEEVSIGEKKYTVVKGTNNPEYEKITIGRYKSTKKNLKQLEDVSEYALVGTEKGIKSKDLKQFPKQVIESIEKQKIFTATGIYERVAKTKKPKPKPAQQFKPSSDLGTIEIKTTKKDNIEINARPSKSGSELKKLEEIAKAQYKPAESLGKEIKITSQASKISLGISTAQQARQSKQQTTAQGQRSTSLQNFRISQGQNLDSDLIQISKVIPDTKLQDLIKTGIETTLRTRQRENLGGLYSLLVSKGLKESELQKLKTKITQKQKEIFEFKIPTKGPPSKEKFTPTPPPAKPVTPVGKIRIESSKPKKKGKLFFRWNVNELSPGMYLPTKELTTGKTAKAIRKVERLQNKVSKRKIKFNLNIK